MKNRLIIAGLTAALLAGGVATASVVSADAITKTPRAGAPTNETTAVHYYHLGAQSRYLLPAVRPTAWKVTKSGSTYYVNVTVHNPGNTPSAADIWVSYASPTGTKIYVPAGGTATARVKVTTELSKGYLDQGRTLPAVTEVWSGALNAEPTAWNKILAAKNPTSALRSRARQIAYYGLTGFRAETALSYSGPATPENAIDPSRVELLGKFYSVDDLPPDGSPTKYGS